MPVEITVRNEDATVALQELGILAANLVTTEAGAKLLGTVATAANKTFDKVLNENNARAALEQTLGAGATLSAASAPETSKRRGRPPKAATKAPEPVLEPPAETPKDVAQDEADEIAEEAETTVAEPVLTHDDIRAAMGDYVKKYGIQNAQADVPKIMGAPKASAVPDDGIAAAVAALKEAVAKNPFERVIAA